MWLVIAPPEDESADWAARGLARRGLAPVRLVAPEQLVYAIASEHRLGRDGVWFTLRTGRGETIDSRRIRGVLNRIRALPTAHLERAGPEDRDYAVEEWHALLLSWLAAVDGPVVNPPAPAGFGGQPRTGLEWRLLAGQAGLATDPLALDSRAAVPLAAGPARRPAAAVLVLDGEAFGRVPPPVAEACVRLRQLAGERLLGIVLARDKAGRWRFLDATPLPDLRPGGAAFLDALARALADPGAEDAA